MVTITSRSTSSTTTVPGSCSLIATTKAIIVRLQRQDRTVHDLDELSDLFTQWWRTVVKMDLPWKEKQKAAKALAYFRASYETMPLTTARELRLRTQHILNLSRATRLPTDLPTVTAALTLAELATVSAPVTSRPAVNSGQPSEIAVGA